LGAVGAVTAFMTIVGSPAGLPSYVAGLFLGFLLAVSSVLVALAFGYAWARFALAGFLWASLAVQTWTFSVALATGGLRRTLVVAFAAITAAGAANLHGQSVRNWVAAADVMRRQRFPPGSGWGLVSGVLALFAGAGVWTQLGRDFWLAIGKQGSAPYLEQQVFGAVGLALALFGIAALKHSRVRLYVVLGVELAIVVGHVGFDLGRAGDKLAFNLTLAVLILSTYFAASRPGLKAHFDAIASRSNHPPPPRHKG
jgi:hypothetical protein